MRTELATVTITRDCRHRHFGSDTGTGGEKYNATLGRPPQGPQPHRPSAHLDIPPYQVQPLVSILGSLPTLCHLVQDLIAIHRIFIFQGPDTSDAAFAVEVKCVQALGGSFQGLSSSARRSCLIQLPN